MNGLADFIHISHVDYDFEPFLSAVENWSQMPDFPSHWRRATTGIDTVSDKRSNDQLDLQAVLVHPDFALHPVSVMFKELHLNIDQFLVDYKEEYSIPLRFDNGWGLNRYSVSNEYIPHYDWSPHEERTVSIVVMLNDVEDGGELAFTHLDVEIPAKKGTVVVFPSSFPYLHASLPVKSGIKYSLVSWLG